MSDRCLCLASRKVGGVGVGGNSIYTIPDRGSKARAKDKSE